MTSLMQTYTHNITKGIDVALRLDEDSVDALHECYTYFYDKIIIDEDIIAIEDYTSDAWRMISPKDAFMASSDDGEFMIRGGCKMFTSSDGSFRFMTSCPTGKDLMKAVISKWHDETPHTVKINKKTGHTHVDMRYY